MIAKFFTWWFARLAELRAVVAACGTVAPCSAVMIEADDQDNLAVSLLNRDGSLEAIPLSAVCRLGRRMQVILRPPASAVLVKQHRVPAASRRELDNILRHELSRITPFTAEALFWRWDVATPSDARAGSAITLTMVPRSVCATALAKLEQLGIIADYVDARAAGKRYLLPADRGIGHRGGVRLFRGLAWACLGLSIVALLLPLVRQAVALRHTESEIAALQPELRQVQALRRIMTARQAERDILRQETVRVGDVLEILATLTRALPDDSFLTNLVLQHRRLTLSGQADSAAHLITTLSANPAIHDPSFAAPVMHSEKVAADIFLIRATYGP